jgi:putative component of toxin-antitoxin plasmid stabilization module
MIQIEVTDELDKWLKGLRDLQAKERIFERIRRLRDGNAGDVKPVGKGVSEMRISYGRAIGSITCSGAKRSSSCCVVAISQPRKKTSPAPSRW